MLWLTGAAVSCCLICECPLVSSIDARTVADYGLPGLAEAILTVRPTSLTMNDFSQRRSSLH